MARESYAVGLKVKLRLSGQPDERSVVAMAELDPRANANDRIESMEETQPFILGRTANQVTAVGQNLKGDHVQEIGRVLTRNKDLFAWTTADMLGIHPDVISHKLSLFKDAGSVS